MLFKAGKSGKAKTAEHASELIKRIYREEKMYVKKELLVLHSDNGSPMKGATMLETTADIYTEFTTNTIELAR